MNILDPKGENINPLNNKAYSNEYKELAKKWSQLPTYKKIDKIIDTIDKNQIVLIVTSTGSGKSLLIPRTLLHYFNYDKKVAVTLPKQIIAKTLSEYVAKTMDVDIGKDVGYKYKGSDKKGNSDNTKLLFTTDGTILAKILNDNKLSEYDGLVIDELHEARINITFLLYLLKETLLMRPEFKLILMSATIDDAIYRDYYKDYKFDVINIFGERNYDIESIFLTKPLSEKEFIPKGIEIITDIMEKSSEDILFFVTSVNETFDTCKKITTDGKTICIEVYAGLTDEREKLAQQKNDNQKIIISTNVAESSMTFDNLKYVIDCGLELHSYYDPIIRSKVLDKSLISKGQAIQRMGRVGRTGKGICYHLYTKNDFENVMKKFPEPEIVTSNLLSESFKLLVLPSIQTTLKLKNTYKNFIHIPTDIYINDSIEQLYQLGLLDEIDSDKTNINNYILNEFGKNIYDISRDPMVGMTIYAGYNFNCVKEVIIIISMLDAMKNSISELFIIPKNNDNKNNNLLNKFNNAKNNLSHKTGDHLSLLKIFLQYKKYTKTNNNTKLNEWLYNNFLKKDVLYKANKHFQKIYGTLKGSNINKKNMDNVMSHSLENRIIASFLFGYKINIAKYNKNNNSYNTSLSKNIFINKNSFINLKETYKELLYNEIFTSSNKSELIIVSQISQKSKSLCQLLS
jgi:pre-mRNA-splicing factor ATP-dependent RNA helicase DHX15/PRP43